MQTPLRVLITGASGFVGSHLLKHLLSVTPSAPAEMFGTVLFENEQARLTAISPNIHVTALDLCDPDATEALWEAAQPDVVYHLAGQAFVPRSFEAPWETLEANIRGTLNLLMSALKFKSAARLLIVGSADVYGTAQPDELPLTERSPFRPSSPYSVSKIAQDMLAWQYATAHKLHTIRVRPFNHIGPGQSGRFAIADWARQIAEAEVGQREPILRVGNLSAARDLTDVRDVVAAYQLAVSAALPGEVFNVCSGQAHTMQHVIDLLVGMAAIPIHIETDPARFRPVDIPILYGDASALRERTGWQPHITLMTSLADVLAEQRAAVRAQQTG